MVGGPTATNIGDDGIGTNETPILAPLYLTEFVLETINILFSPNVDDYQDGIAETIKRFQDCVLGVENLVPDTYFDAFTRFVNQYELEFVLYKPPVLMLFYSCKWFFCCLFVCFFCDCHFDSYVIIVLVMLQFMKTNKTSGEKKSVWIV